MSEICLSIELCGKDVGVFSEPWEITMFLFSLFLHLLYKFWFASLPVLTSFQNISFTCFWFLYCLCFSSLKLYHSWYFIWKLLQKVLEVFFKLLQAFQKSFQRALNFYVQIRNYKMYGLGCSQKCNWIASCQSAGKTYAFGQLDELQSNDRTMQR